MAGSISTIVLSDPTKRYRARCSDAAGRQHEKRYKRKVGAQHWLDEQTSALVTQTWTAPERNRISVEAWAQQWLAAQTGLKPSTSYRYRSLLRSQVLPRWGPPSDGDVIHADVPRGGRPERHEFARRGGTFVHSTSRVSAQPCRGAESDGPGVAGTGLIHRRGLVTQTRRSARCRLRMPSPTSRTGCCRCRGAFSSICTALTIE